MRGILARGGHRLATVPDPKEALGFLEQHIKIDVVFMDLPAKGGGMDLVRQLRQHSIFKILPIVIYASQADRAAVHTALDLKVQTYLVKPYHDESIFSEIAKALANPWRQQLFEEEKSFCALLAITPPELHKMLEDLQGGMTGAVEAIKTSAGNREPEPALAKLIEVSAAAEAAGAWGAVEVLNALKDSIERGDWNGALAGVPTLECAARLVWVHLNPAFIPEPLLTDQEREAEKEQRERDLWTEAELRGRFPVVPPDKIKKQVEALAGCPIVDGPAAMFQMLANGQRSSLIPIMDQVEKDPGLAAQILIAANHLKRNEEHDASPIEDLRHGIELLGELKLAQMAKSLVTLEERHLRAMPFTWARFWIFQIAVARMSRLLSSYLEYKGMETRAYTAGLLHDLGKLILADLYPFGWQAIMAFARKNGISTGAAELRMIGCSARELADIFCLSHQIPDCYRMTMRHLEAPEEAEGYQELVAIVALARDVCRRNRLGHDGDQPPSNPPPMEETPAWKVLGPRIYLGFNWQHFEGQMHASCQEIKRELHGWLEAPAQT